MKFSGLFRKCRLRRRKHPSSSSSLSSSPQHHHADTVTPELKEREKDKRKHKHKHKDKDKDWPREREREKGNVGGGVQVDRRWYRSVERREENEKEKEKEKQKMKEREVEWEVRPGGMLVQRREASALLCPPPSSSLGPLIFVKVSFGNRQLDVTIPHQSTFGDMKWALEKESGLKPKEQRILYKGKEKDDADYLHIAGVENQAKLILIEDPASKERKMHELNKRAGISEAFRQVTLIREEVDKLACQLTNMERVVRSKRTVGEREVSTLLEMLMRQLLKLDAINAEGDAKAQRRTEVKRVQQIIEAVDCLKAQNNHSLTSVVASKGMHLTWV